ncbi:MAG: flagellar basal body rod protein FlgB [Nevskiaceae bacterium]|nr:MAG: flagellar basal body rod protein FlgB [Nevskiaceae bacterium]TBR71583.1 MAG: flagellar basal body rod protein FlgB [Nevskiaceae bacterium]
MFGLQARSLDLQSQRLSLIANNLANSDTPGFQPRDIDFQSALRAAESGDLKTAQAKSEPQATVQPTIDGNGVESSQQQAAFADAALRYEASLSFINVRIQMLNSAFTGN